MFKKKDQMNKKINRAIIFGLLLPLIPALISLGGMQNKNKEVKISTVNKRTEIKQIEPLQATKIDTIVTSTSSEAKTPQTAPIKATGSCQEAIKVVFVVNHQNMAKAISLAENTSQNPRAISATGDYGCFQINKASHFKNGLWRGKYTFEQVYDPTVNAKLAYEISHSGTYWGAWTTFTSGKYLNYL
jgi:hypothetical protein